MRLRFTVEDVYSPVATDLIEELEEELTARYPGMDGDSDFDHEDITVPRSAFVVAWVEEQAVGSGAIRPMEDERIAEVKRMYVRPAWRAKRISRRVLTYLEALAREFGYEQLQLETGIRQPEAIGLYESAGFYRIPNYGRYEGDPWSICYKKDL